MGKAINYEVKQASLKHSKMVVDMYGNLSGWRRYYRAYSKVDFKLTFREYEVLENGLLMFIDCRDYNYPVFAKMFLRSLLRSFELFEGRYLCSIGEKNYEFIMMIEICRENLEAIGNELFEDFLVGS